MQGPAKLVGARVKRVEDGRFLVGQGQYLGGMKWPGMLEVAFTRSSHAHAKLREIRTDAARALPGVECVYTWADLSDRLKPFCALLDPEKNPTYKPCDQHPLAHGKVRFVGEPIAAVLACDRYVAEDAAALVEVDLETLPAIVDPERALTDKSNLVHEEWGDNVLCHTDFSAYKILPTQHGNKLYHWSRHLVEGYAFAIELFKTAPHIRSKQLYGFKNNLLP